MIYNEAWKVGIVSIDGQTILPAEYDSIYNVSDRDNPINAAMLLNTDAVKAVKNDKTGVITIDGETVIPFQYDGIDIDYGIPNNYYRAEYFATLTMNGDQWTIGAVNRKNQRIADPYTFSQQEVIEYRQYIFNYIIWPYAVYSFSPINGLINGFSGYAMPADFKTRPESPVIKYTGYSEVKDGKLLYGASYHGRGAVVVFDGFNDAQSPELDGWPRDIALTIDQKKWTFNGVTLENDVAPFISKEDRSMAPVRVVAESLGATVTWKDWEKTAYITMNGKTLTLLPDKPLPGSMGTPVIKDDRLLVPVRYIAENYGGTVSWEHAAKTVSIRAAFSIDSP